MAADIKKFQLTAANKKARVFLTGNFQMIGNKREVEIRSIDTGQKCFVTLDLLKAYTLVPSDKARVISFTRRNKS